MPKYFPLESGQKFNRLTIVKLHSIEKNKKNQNKEYYECICDCGSKCIISKHGLKYGHSKSCGCLNEEKRKINGLHNKKHGLTYTKLYNVWQTMKARCYNKNSKNFKDYGCRSIKMCDEWKNDFQVFYNWAMSNGYIWKYFRPLTKE